MHLACLEGSNDLVAVKLGHPCTGTHSIVYENHLQATFLSLQTTNDIRKTSNSLVCAHFSAAYMGHVRMHSSKRRCRIAQRKL